MASAAEQLASNINFASFAKAKELQQRIFFTLAVLVAYRLGTYIPVPGIDPVQYQAVFDSQAGGVIGVFNIFSGGAVERMAIFALNVMPYISASIIMQLMAATVPSLEKMKKEGGDQGRKQINQYSRYLTVLLAAVQGGAIAMSMMTPGVNGQTVALNPGIFFLVSTTLTFVGGTMLLMWMGEQITSRGVGNGISLIIFTGIVSVIPQLIYSMFEQARQGQISGGALLGILALMLATFAFVVFIERSQRRLLVQYPKRQQGQRIVGGDTSFLPLKLNTAGVIPAIFATSLLLLPTTVANMWATTGPEWLQLIAAQLGRGQPLFIALYGAMVIFFAFFYTSIVFNPEEVSENLRKYGGFLPGIRPGKRTAEYLDYVLTRLTMIGALYLAIVVLIPEFLTAGAAGAVTFALGGTSILIVVSVAMDTVTQIQSHLLAHQYEGLIKKQKLRGRNR